MHKSWEGSLFSDLLDYVSLFDSTSIVVYKVFMNTLFYKAKSIVPEPIKNVVKRSIYHYKNRAFKPYIKKKNVEGVQFDFWIGDSYGRDWYDIHSTDPQCDEMRFIRDSMIQPGDIIFECGAHHGCMTIILSNWTGNKGKVIAFEPVPKNCEIIMKNIELNQLTNVTLEQKAIGAARGKTRISGVSNSSIVLSGSGTEVEVIPLDEYEYLSPTFLKIDVEGFEAEVLKGAKKILSKNPKLAIEIHTESLAKYGASVEELFHLIGSDNYTIWIQWDDMQQPEPYTMDKAITQRVHFFGIPKEAPHI